MVTKSSSFDLTPYMGFVASSIAGIVFGALFYSRAMFHYTWIKHSNRQMTHEPKWKLTAKSFLINLMFSIALAKLIDLPSTPTQAAIRGLFVGLCLVTASIWHNYLYTSVKAPLFAVDGLYYTSQCGLMALVLQMFRSPNLMAASIV